MLQSRRANAHLLVKFNAWTSQSNLQVNRRILAYLKFGKICNRAEENLPKRKLRVGTANDTELPHVFI